MYLIELMAGRPSQLRAWLAGRRDARVVGAQPLGALQRGFGVVPLAPPHVDEGDADERVGERRIPAGGVREWLIASPGRPASSRIDPIHRCGSSVTGS